MRRTLLFLFSIIVITLTGCKTSSVITQEDIARHDLAVEMVKNKTFLVKADRMSIKHHTIPSVSNTTNFVMVDGNKAVVQVSPGNSGGPNGVGGFTVDGSITGYEVKIKDNGEVYVRYHVQAIAGSCDVAIRMIKSTNDVTVNITSTFRGGTATMYGKLMPIDDSVVTGRTRY